MKEAAQKIKHGLFHQGTTELLQSSVKEKSLVEI